MAAFLILDAFVGFDASSLLSLSKSCRHCWRLLIIGGISLLLSVLESCCRQRCLVVIAFLLVLVAYSLLISASVIFSALSLLLPSASCRRCHCWRLVCVGGIFLLLLLSASRCRRRRLVVVFGVLLSSLFCRCRWRHPFLWLLPSDHAPHRCCRRWCLVVVVGVSCCRRRLVFVVVVGFLSLLLSEASCGCCWWWRFGVLWKA